MNLLIMNRNSFFNSNLFSYKFPNFDSNNFEIKKNQNFHMNQEN